MPDLTNDTCDRSFCVFSVQGVASENNSLNLFATTLFLPWLAVVQSANSIALVGQNFAHWGLPEHKLHFVICFFVELKEMFPNGHALMHILHAMHFFGSGTTAPFSSLKIAPRGQTFIQAASSHCMHIIGTETSGVSK